MLYPRKGPLAIAVAPAIGLGIMKIYLHFFSTWRLGFLDYLVSLGLILGGLFLFYPPRSRIVLLASAILIAVELFKLASDYKDLFDVFLVIVAILYLSIPTLRYVHARSNDASEE
jgi:hypothetical protein